MADIKILILQRGTSSTLEAWQSKLAMDSVATVITQGYLDTFFNKLASVNVGYADGTRVCTGAQSGLSIPIGTYQELVNLTVTQSALYRVTNDEKRNTTNSYYIKDSSGILFLSAERD